MGLFQEALEAMFALINEMEMAIKINTSIIFGKRARLIQPLQSGIVSREEKKKRKKVASLVKKYSTNMKGC